MASFEFLAIILTGLGLTASIVYYATVIRNQNKTQKMQLETRQAQLLMQVYSTLYTADEWRNYLEAQYQAEFSDYQDFQEKYGRGNPDFYSKILSVWWSYNTVGSLLRQGLLNVDSVNDLMGTMIERQWDKWGEVIRDLRKDIESPTAFIDFEYLYLRTDLIRTPEHKAERMKEVLDTNSRYYQPKQ